MHELILIDKASGLEVGRRPMVPQERYQLYEDCREHTILNPRYLTHDAKQYTLHTVAWQLPAEDCMVSVTYQGRERMACGCEAGCCSCC